MQVIRFRNIARLTRKVLCEGTMLSAFSSDRKTLRVTANPDECDETYAFELEMGEMKRLYDRLKSVFERSE